MHVLAFDNSDKPCGHLGYRNFNIHLDLERELTVIGIGGVVVRPEAQGRGIPSQLFNFVHQSSHAKSLSDIFMLFCPRRLESYYEKHGYVTFSGPYTFLQKGNVIKTDKFALMYRGALMPTQTIHVPSEPW